MVLVASGPFGSGNASGSIAGSTYSHNRFGQYVRNRTKPVNPKSAGQVAIRTALAQLTSRWSNELTTPQRTAWETYAANVVMKNKLGQDILLTGFNHYLRANVERLRSLYTVHNDGPTVFELPEADPQFAITASEATQTITCAYDATLDWNNEANGHLWIYQGLPTNRQRTFFGGPWRLVGCQTGSVEDPPASPYLAAALFPIAAPQRLWCYARISRGDGRLSAPFSTQCLVGA